jgi:hypothetical protein
MGPKGTIPENQMKRLVPNFTANDDFQSILLIIEGKNNSAWTLQIMGNVQAIKQQGNIFEKFNLTFKPRD